MKEKSIYEGSFNDKYANKTCLGVITSVDADRRRCRVKTIGLKGITHDLDLPDVQFMLTSSHKDGDEETFLPRIGALAVVIFINSEPLVIGYYQQINTAGPKGPPEKEPLRSGDKVIKTVGGNKFIMRSGGSCEITSTAMCRTYWSPNSNTMTSTVQNFEVEASGGFMHWEQDEDDDSTQLLFRCYDFSGGANNTVEISVGTNKNVTEDEVLSINLGPAAADNTIASKTFSLQVLADGTTTVVVNSKCTLKIDPSGNVSLDTQGTMTATAVGAVSVTTQGSATFNAKGPTTVRTDASMLLEAKSMTLMADGNPVPGNLVTDNFQNIDPITGISLIGHPGINVP
jgi:hypothetical protein